MHLDNIKKINELLSQGIISAFTSEIGSLEAQVKKIKLSVESKGKALKEKKEEVAVQIEEPAIVSTPVVEEKEELPAEPIVEEKVEEPIKEDVKEEAIKEEPKAEAKS